MLKNGIRNTEEVTVTKELTAAELGSGLLPVSRGKDARRAAGLGYCGPESS